jgi:hypothetical protein
MNSFLDSDKIAALWWGFIAIIVAKDLKSGRGNHDFAEPGAG